MSHRFSRWIGGSRGRLVPSRGHVLSAATAVLVLVSAAQVVAQTPYDDGLRMARRKQLIALEQFLFAQTNKTTQVVFAERHDTSVADEPIFCGEALFGTRRGNFVVNIQAQQTLVAITPKQWRDAGCDKAARETLIDLR